MIGTGVDEVHESSTAIELGEKHGCVCLRFGRFDPSQTRSYATILTTPFSQDSASITAHSHRFCLALDSDVLFPFCILGAFVGSGYGDGDSQII